MFTIESIYAAWHAAGVDISGGDWNRFVAMLEAAQKYQVINPVVEGSQNDCK